MKSTINLSAPMQTVQNILDKTLELEIYLYHWLNDQETPEPMKVKYIQKDLRQTRAKWLYEYASAEKHTIGQPLAFLLITLSQNKQTELLVELVCPKHTSTDAAHFLQNVLFPMVRINLEKHVLSQSR